MCSHFIRASKQNRNRTPRYLSSVNGQQSKLVDAQIRNNEETLEEVIRDAVFAQTVKFN